jgi:hypothetical protein
LQNGKYPDSLKQLSNNEGFVNIQDPVKGLNASEKDVFIYKNLYFLFFIVCYSYF